MKIVVLIGLPGSGKSTWLERQGAGGLSSDAIRKLLTDDEDNQTANARVFETLRYLLRQRLAIGREVTYVDATNLTASSAPPTSAWARSTVRGGGRLLRYAAGHLPRAQCRQAPRSS